MCFGLREERGFQGPLASRVWAPPAGFGLVWFGLIWFGELINTPFPPFRSSLDSEDEKPKSPVLLVYISIYISMYLYI